MEPQFVPTGEAMDVELERLLADEDDGGPSAMFRARDDAARDDAAASMDAQILAGLVFP